MKIIGWLIDWILFTSVFAASCALGLCMATERLINSRIPTLVTPLHTLVFGSTLVVYNIHHIIKKSSPDKSDLYKWSQYYKLWQFIFCVIGFLICAISIFLLSWKIITACCVLAVLSFAYSLPLLPFGNKKQLRDFGWVKILVLDSVWTIVTVILPILYWNKRIRDFPLEILIRFSFLFTLCVAFDIRDMQTDQRSGIHTLPNVIGIKNSYRVMDVAIILFALLSIIQYTHYPVVERLVGELITAAVIKLVINYIRKYPSDRAYLGLVDGMMMLYALLVLLH